MVCNGFTLTDLVTMSHAAGLYFIKRYFFLGIVYFTTAIFTFYQIKRGKVLIIFVLKRFYYQVKYVTKSVVI